jgi:beta-hydroxylase
MILDPEHFSFTRDIERHYPVFRRELDSLADDEFTVWPAVGAYCGTWRVFPFIEHCAPEDFHSDFEANCARCPETSKILHSLPAVRGAAFSRLDPGSAIMPHEDKPVSGILRTHLGLKIPMGSQLIVGGEIYHWTEGKMLLFDGQIEHAALNESSESRDLLIIDMVLTPDERAYAGIA